jgi:copper(I)-binding protein
MIGKWNRLALAAAFSVTSCTKPDGLEVRDAWARDSIGGVANAAVFMTIRSPIPDRLVSASSPVAERTDLMTIAGGSEAMRMVYVKAIDIPASQPVSLGPGGFHVWLDGLNQPLKAGESFPLQLQFDKAGQKRVTVSVIGAAASPPTAN